MRNEGLYGGMQSIAAHTYKDGETTLDGRSKAGWKMVRFLANDDFLMALEDYPKDFRFTLGSGKIQIRGGRRRVVNALVSQENYGRINASSSAPLVKRMRTASGALPRRASAPAALGAPPPALLRTESMPLLHAISASDIVELSLADLSLIHI